ncbi:MAG: pitrilysin family protein [Candidatus Taylorbacteria bacterium]
MINLKKLDGPFGIPVYHQHTPEMANTVSMAWLMMVGSADDCSVGSPGLYHWFEHVPFRGTKKYPRGAADIYGPFVPFNGDINAWTSKEYTNFNATVHKSQWREMLSVITDMVANPLLTEESIEAERRVIYQEIIGSLGSAGRRALYDLSGILYPGHPLGHPVLGSEKSLAEMDADVLRLAHKLGYDRSRAVFVCVGGISEKELLDALSAEAANLPDHQLSELRGPAYFGPLPSWQPGLIEKETDFASSVVYMLFPTIRNQGGAAIMTKVVQDISLLDLVFEYGGFTSPLVRIVREERQLVYGCSMMGSTYAGGGYYGFKASAKKDNIQGIVEAFGDVLRDPALRSLERLSEIKSSLSASMEMMPINPEVFRNQAASQYINYGGVMISSQEAIDHVHKYTMDDVDAALSMLQPQDAKIVIFKGMGKS